MPTPGKTPDPDGEDQSRSRCSVMSREIYRMKTLFIPNSIPSNRLVAAKFYRDILGLAVHPLHGPADKNVPEKARGKKPLRSGWKTWTTDQATDDVLGSYFGDGIDANIGIVVRAPHVVVDLDSKPDKGASVRAWLATQSHLASVPREKTAGGAHLHFVCHDLPAMTRNGKAFEKALTLAVSDDVMAELYFDGLNVAIAPSIHASGVQYEWEVTGDIPAVTWKQLQQWFGFRLPDDEADAKETKARKGSAKPAEWWTRYKGDLTTLDCAAIFKLGDLLDAEERKYAAECPWRDEHSEGAEPWRANDTSTVLYLPKEGRQPPGFDCKHAHCSERKIKDALELMESKQPGVVDLNCKLTRTWKTGQSSPDGRPRILLSGRDRPESEFAMEVGKAIGPKKVWFTHGDSVVEVCEKKLSDKVRCLAFHRLEPAEVCTAIEDHVAIGILTDDASNNQVFSALSMSERAAKVLLESPQFRRELPRIHRILKIPVPILHGGMLVFPCPGYDERFHTYTDPGAPAVMPMDIKTAKMWLHKMLEGFAFDGAQSTRHAVARLLTAVCRGLIGWDARTPFWLFTANRERLGKDYLAGTTGLICEGFANEDAPLEPRNSTETRKRITSAILAGRPRMHFANCRLHIEDSALEQAITSKFWSDRVLGANTDVNLPNEIEFSMSANLGITYTADLAHRSRRIGLFFAGENPNARTFSQPDLHRWVLGNRSELLSALVALVRHWYEAGQPGGQTPFASFPEWAKIVGGIMQTASLGDPCLPDAVADSAGGDETAVDMKTLFQVAHEKWGDRRVELKQILALVTDDESNQLFGWMKLEEKSGQTWFGKQLRRYVGRVVGGILLRIHDAAKRRQKFSFEPSQEGGPDGGPRPVDELFQAISPGPTPVGDIGNIGNISISNAQGQEHKTPGGGEGTCRSPVWDGLQKVANVAKVAKPVIPPIITTPAALPEIAAAIPPGTTVALDIETYGRDALNPFRGDIRLLSLRLPDRAPWLLDLKAIGYDLGPLKLALESAEIVGHNLKFDALWLSVKAGLKLKKVFCSCTAARLLTAGSKQDNSLGECLRRYLDVDLPKDQARSDWGSRCLSNEQIAYSANDVHHLHALKAVLERELDDAGLVDVARLEMELLPVVVEMEARGFPVDRARLEALRDEAKSCAESILRSLRTELGVELNPNSPTQIKAAFAAKGVEISDTKEETLAAAGHPLARLLLRFRKSEQMRRQAETFLEATEPDGRIHAQFNPAGTETGRFSCGNPNLQNVGRGDMRACFTASPGHRLVVADYSQIELRIAAVLAGEERMLEAYRQGADLHRQTAAMVLNKVLADVTDEDRQLAKAVNFGLLYGQSAKGLVVYARSSYGVELTLERATEIRQQFFAGYEGLQAWHKRAWKQASGSTREVRTITGRRRILPSGEDKEWQRFTSLVNNPVQGSSADAMKRAMVNLAKLLPEGTGMVSTIHDELIVEAPEREAEAIKDIVVRTMIEAMNQLFPQVPIEVDARVCATWAKTKPAGPSA